MSVRLSVRLCGCTTVLTLAQPTGFLLSECLLALGEAIEMMIEESQSKLSSAHSAVYLARLGPLAHAERPLNSSIKLQVGGGLASAHVRGRHTAARLLGSSGVQRGTRKAV